MGLVALLFAFFHISTLQAQTVTGQYVPGAMIDGAVYFLPKTAVRIAVLVEKSTYTPGDFAPYAERYLRLNNVSPEPSVSYRVLSLKQSALGVRDTTKAYNVRFSPKTSAINVATAEDGVLLAINATGTRQVEPQPFRPAAKPIAVNPRQFMNE